MTQIPVTIYRSTEMFGSIVKNEGKILDYGTRKYAQYENAAFVEYIPKRKRNGFRFIKGYDPYFLVIKGHGHPDTPSMFGEPFVDANGTTIKQSSYSSFDERYKQDFDKIIDTYLEDKQDLILMDIRNTKNTNIINK